MHWVEGWKAEAMFNSQYATSWGLLGAVQCGVAVHCTAPKETWVQCGVHVGRLCDNSSPETSPPPLLRKRDRAQLLPATGGSVRWQRGAGDPRDKLLWQGRQGSIYNRLRWQGRHSTSSGGSRGAGDKLLWREVLNRLLWHRGRSTTNRLRWRLLRSSGAVLSCPLSCVTVADLLLSACLLVSSFFKLPQILSHQ